MNELFPSLHWSNLLILPSLLIGYTIHELAHALTAYFLGDHSQVERRKITLNPLEHVSWFGAFAFIVIGIGWPKNLSVNPHNFKRRHLDMFFVAIAGPLASFTLSLTGLLVTLTVAALLVHSSGVTTDRVFQLFFPISNLPETLNIQALSLAFTGYIATTSFWLTFMSLLPLPGQDGFMAIASLIAFFQEKKRDDSIAHRQPTPQISNLIMNQRKLRNNAADIHFKIGAEYHQGQQYDDAVVRYRQAIANDQNFGPAYINLGLAYLAKNDRRKAIQAFRGAIQYADDERSGIEAWHQLHRLSEVSPVNHEEAKASMAELGAAPWTDIKPQPNWWTLGVASGLLLISSIGLYAYLLTRLIELLKV